MFETYEVVQTFVGKSWSRSVSGSGWRGYSGAIELFNESNWPHTSEAELQRQKLSMDGASRW